MIGNNNLENIEKRYEKLIWFILMNVKSELLFSSTNNFFFKVILLILKLNTVHWRRI